MGPSIAGHLRRLLEDRHAPARLRVASADALTLLRDLPAAETAEAVLRETAQPTLQEAALRLLGRVGHPQQTQVVRPLCRAPQPAVRGAALRTLGHLGDGRDLPRLRAALGDASASVAMAAAQGLIGLGDREPLRQLAGSDHPRAPLARELLEAGGKG